MKRLLTLLALLAISGTAMAGFSLGFKPLDLPVIVGEGDYYSSDAVNMLRIGWGASEDFRIEVLAGYGKVNLEVSDEVTVEYSGSCFAMGLSGFYVIASPSNTVFSIGGSFVYNKASTEVENEDDSETSGYSIYPLMRIDFAIPGAERLGIFSEFGARYVSATTTDDSDTEWKATDFGTWGSQNILGGVYYSF